MNDKYIILKSGTILRGDISAVTIIPAVRKRYPFDGMNHKRYYHVHIVGDLGTISISKQDYDELKGHLRANYGTEN